MIGDRKYPGSFNFFTTTSKKISKCLPIQNGRDVGKKICIFLSIMSKQTQISPAKAFHDWKRLSHYVQSTSAGIRNYSWDYYEESFGKAVGIILVFISFEYNGIK